MSVINDKNHFRFTSDFIKSYKNKRPNFGFNGLGEFVYYRTYSRLKDDGSKETFLDTLVRVVEGCYEIQRQHCLQLHIPWDLKKAQSSAQEMFQRMWEFKFLPPGRGLWMMGTEFMWTRGSAALNNCAMVSTDSVGESDPSEPFCFMMDMAMLGVGVGFDTKGAGKIKIVAPHEVFNEPHVIDDSREGWVSSLKILIHSYTTNPELGVVEFDYSKIRKPGSLIKGFGGKASGPYILQELHVLVRTHLANRIGSCLSSVDITDIMNYIGRCVVAGNVRRTAQIAFGESDDSSYCEMKNPLKCLNIDDISQWSQVVAKLYAEERYTATLNDFKDTTIPHDRLKPAVETWNALNHHRWASNNSIFAKVGDNYNEVSKQIAVNGEPGLLWLDNVRDYGRMIDGYKPGIDGRAVGSNPCLAGSNRLLTATGYKTIEELWVAGGCQEYDGNPTIEKHGELKIVNRDGVVSATNVYRTSESAAVLRISFNNGQYIDATPNHRFVVVHGSTEVIVEAKDLIVGCKVPLGLTKAFGSNDDLNYALLAGWVIGDGSLSPQKDGQVAALVSCYESDVDDVMPTLRSALVDVYERNFESSHQKPIFTPWERKQAHFRHRQTNIRSSVLGRLLKADGVVPGDKHNVPTSVWSGNQSMVAAFLRGLFSADGSVQVSNHKKSISIRCAQVNRKLLDECQLLLAQFGIASTVSQRTKPTKSLMNDGKGGLKLYNRKALYELIIGGMANVRSFMLNIGFIQSCKNNKANNWLENHHGSANSTPKTWREVVDIAYLNNQQTYCLTEPATNRVIVNGIVISQCVEQSLESYELCCLVETFPANHDNADDFMRTLKFAYLYAKTVTLLPTHNPRSNQVMLRNRRIGLSQSGIIQAFSKFGRRQVLQEFCDAGYNEIKKWDQIYSDWLCIPKSIKVTSVKPSGTVSIVAGATPGIHHPEASTYWRLVRVAKDSILVKILRDAGYRIEPASSDPDRTVVVYFAITDERVLPVSKITIWEQMQNASDYQHYWADNQVSCTIKFKPSEIVDLPRVLEAHEDRQKGISFLPHQDHGYNQAPYTPCTPDEVKAYNANLQNADYAEYIYEASGSLYCENDSCAIQ